jgi:hypothetical protein
MEVVECVICMGAQPEVGERCSRPGFAVVLDHKRLWRWGLLFPATAAHYYVHTIHPLRLLPAYQL